MKPKNWFTTSEIRISSQRLKPITVTVHLSNTTANRYEQKKPSRKEMCKNTNHVVLRVIPMLFKIILNEGQVTMQDPKRQMA